MKYFLIPFLLISAQAFAEERTARIFEIGKTEPSFLQKTEITDSGSGHIHSLTTVKDNAGKTVLTEDAEFTGDRLIHQHMVQFQIEKAYDVSVEGKTVTFKTFSTKSGKEVESEKPKTEDFTDEFLTGPVSEAFVQKNWKALIDGDTIHSRFGVLEIAETVGFKFFEVPSDIKGLIDIRMKASSIFISMAVSPLEIFYDPTSHRMVRFKGRTPIRKLNSGKWENIDADIIYDTTK